MPEDKPITGRRAAPGVMVTVGEGGAPSDPAFAELMKAGLAARVQFCKQEIAEAMYSPLPVPAVWAGRDELLVKLVKQFECAVEAGNAAIDAAVAELWAIDRPDDRNVQVQLHRQRLRMLRQLVLDSMKVGRKETTFQFEENPLDKNSVIAKPVKEKRYSGIEMGQVRALLEIDAAYSGSFAGEQSGASNLMAAFFGELDKRVEGRRAASKAGEVRNRGFEQLGEAGQARVEAAMRELLPDGRKVIEAKVVDAPPAGKRRRGRKGKSES